MDVSYLLVLTLLFFNHLFFPSFASEISLSLWPVNFLPLLARHVLDGSHALAFPNT